MCVDRGTFSDEATFTCEKRDVYNVTIWINAIPCNGIGDCIWDKDELDCSLPNFILIVILSVSITICGVFGFFLWQGITFVLPRKKNIHDWPDFDSLHQSDVLKETMFHAQSLENYQDFNSKMVEMEMKMHDKNISEVVCCIKVKFSYATLILFLSIPIIFLPQNFQDSSTVGELVNALTKKGDSEESTKEADQKESNFRKLSTYLRGQRFSQR